MIFAQRNNLDGECFGRVILTFDGQASPTVPLSLQCSPDMTTCMFTCNLPLLKVWVYF